jgi:hypothetical protein
MRYEQLSRHDQELLNTDLGDFDKEASAMVKMASEGYEIGFEKIALEIADSLEIQAIEENMDKTASDDELDPESEKTAAEMGAFIERGVFEGLQKLGQERYGNPDIYIEALTIEKLAAEAAAQTKAEVKRELSNIVGSEHPRQRGNKVTMSQRVTDAKDAVKRYYAGAAGDIADARRGVAMQIGDYGTQREMSIGALNRAGRAAKGVGKMIAPVAVPAALGTYAWKKLKGKKDQSSEQQQ